MKKKKYFEPELDILKFNLTELMLESNTDPEETIGGYDDPEDND